MSEPGPADDDDDAGGGREAGGAPGGQAAVDIDVLADKVYRLLREQVRLEQVRGARSMPRTRG